MNYSITKNSEKTLDPLKPMLPTGIVANLLQLSIKSLRHYEKSKILVPVKTAKNRKLYCLDDLEKGKFIKYLSGEIGINITGMKIIFGLLAQIENLNPKEYMNYVEKLLKVSHDSS